jgi:hypothetical protein
MRHYSEDELILYHFDESPRRDRIDEHLQACESCAASYRAIADTLATVGDVEVPERDERYGLEVWQRIRHRLPVQDAPWWMAWYRPALAGAVAALVIAAFAAGRLWSPASVTNGDRSTGSPTASRAPAPEDAYERVRLVAIGDHLEQSERVLLDLVNAEGDQVDVTDQQAWASDLIDANRLYRDAAEQAGDQEIAGVLEDLGRNLLEIVHGPSTLTPAELEAVRVRLDAGALLFKVRILSDELRERELVPSPPRKTT